MAGRLVIAGAGLAAALIARRVGLADPDAEITIVEAGERPFGEHTWSFHDTDVDRADQEWLAPFVACRWDSQSVVFPSYSRSFACGYASLTSQQVLEVLGRQPRLNIVTGSRVTGLTATGVTFGNGQRIEADCIIDARGFEPSQALVLGYQKFVGIEVELAAPHGLAAPVIMDATVDQIDGYRFVYLLPFSPTRILIEDTRYSDTRDVDVASFEQDIVAYAASRNWTVARRERHESGSLPIALAFDVRRFWAERSPDVACVGLRGGLFHPTTGYSLGEAVRVANLVADNWPLSSTELAAKVRAHAYARARQQSFYRLLSRMLFKAAKPDQRRKVLSRFLRLPQPLVERFYAGKSSPLDKVRILSGRPPVPVAKAMALLSERKFLMESA